MLHDHYAAYGAQYCGHHMHDSGRVTYHAEQLIVRIAEYTITLEIPESQSDFGPKVRVRSGFF